MGVLDNIRGRNDSQHIQAIATPDPDTESKNEAGTDTAADDSTDTASLEARNEKEVEAHPNEVTADANEGVKKAEAAALVWSKKAVYATYAW